ncbi:anaerobic dehydrogenase, typically selenocysteine-containing [Schinkia azotoformans MEV2011]|uniref:Anaerobic dehydrogenase, typically selenocysteine-containing n=1 Tax=Schinkia azotoformans MEV2011 TaxID=1348973 RepID=A0A072NHC5_SCHAZ|nr:molybdopterin-dependent oxidoreductase [Schinkia azotoformans]KEF36318.1 anaerobic dehydrogenase, typically selenocysteine-containing [Schinkia azotoformans MEV2011]MEC1696711.1 molybdopterin-dependent oxidoreductase [Schinkia azotoformans]MEC1716959.1 molybdopterin-dependent oxidoreductase [Schinkia azotoformans]MEC1723635.1 molybdopterin-dependent oxidoreductase [Schinkia azotoformans]MEC1743242.1 molybdopterin-dependent oxidoreductase [Schinkia azotoformans]
MKLQIIRNTCPRNCYGTCGILSYVDNGKLIKVTGDPNHGFNQGRLCAKGYAYTQYVYHPDRLKFPMIQKPRGSGNWTRISWDEAYTIIANKMIELNQRYGSNLALGYNKFSGNLGILHYATEGMFNSLGPHTKTFGNPCAQTGRLAIKNSFGDNYSSVPENMANASLIVIWGSNPAVTNVHQMKFIYEARRKGAKLVVIDPIYTETAKKADLYIQIKPGTDMWLALGIAKILIESGKYEEGFIEKQALGWDAFKTFLEKNLTITEVIEKTGIPLKAIEELTSLYYSIKPTVTWIGLGLQRSHFGKSGIEAINSLAAMTGNLSIPNGGLYFVHFDVEQFPLTLLNHRGPDHPAIPYSREIDISDFSESALSLQNPPLKLLWIASRNIVSQDQNLKAWEELNKQMELIVTVDLFMTKTAEQSDIVLPAASHFEEEDLHVGYWHYWLSINQKAIPPFYEAKSDLTIARELTTKLNELSPGFSNFPADKEPIDWIKEELTPEMMELYNIESYKDLLEGPHQKKKSNIFWEQEEQIRLLSPEKIAEGEQFHDALAKENEFPYQLLTPQKLLKIHSQYEMNPWLHSGDQEMMIEISDDIARSHNLQDKMKVEVFNEHGMITGRVRINKLLPKNIVLAPQAGHDPINQLIYVKNENDQSESSVFFYDSRVKIRKWGEAHV